MCTSEFHFWVAKIYLFFFSVKRVMNERSNLLVLNLFSQFLKPFFGIGTNRTFWPDDAIRLKVRASTMLLHFILREARMSGPNIMSVCPVLYYSLDQSGGLPDQRCCCCCCCCCCCLCPVSFSTWRYFIFWLYYSKMSDFQCFINMY